LSVAKFMHFLIMVNYIIALVFTFLRLHLSTNIKEDCCFAKILFTKKENVSGSTLFKVYWSQNLV